MVAHEVEQGDEEDGTARGVDRRSGESARCAWVRRGVVDEKTAQARKPHCVYSLRPGHVHLLGGLAECCTVPHDERAQLRRFPRENTKTVRHELAIKFGFMKQAYVSFTKHDGEQPEEP